MATLLVSQGVPMILAGDELGHTQKGNNNTYCQDNELTWLRWHLDPEQTEFLEFVRRLIALRREQPVLRRRSFFQGRSLRGSDVKDITFLDPSGQEMADEAWKEKFVKCLGMRLAGNLINEMDEHGEPVEGDTLLVLLNAHHETIPFTLPGHGDDQFWELALQTADVSQQELQRGAEAARKLVPGVTGETIAAADSTMRAVVPAAGTGSDTLVTAEPMLLGGQQFYLQGRSLAILRVQQQH